MASVGDISVSIGLDISDLQRNLDRVERELSELQNSFHDTSNTVNNEVGTMAKAFGGLLSTFAGTELLSGLGNVVGDILSTTSEVQASAEQYEQVMGKLAGNSDKYIDKMSTAWNKHPSELKSAMMQYQAILKGKGVSEEDAFEMSKTILERTVDANAFANEDMASTTDRFMAMIKGEYDSLDTAMVNLSATMMDDTAQEKYGKKFDELSVTQQEQLKVQEAVRQHTSAGVFGQGEREAESYNNHVANLKASFDEFKAVIGSPIIEMASEMLGGLAEALKEVGEWFGSLPKPLQEFAVVVTIVTVAVFGLALALGGVAFALDAIAVAVGATIGMVAGVVAIVIAVVAVVVAIAYLVIKYWDEIKEWTIKTWNTIRTKTVEIWEATKKKAVEIFGSIGKWFSDMWGKVRDKTVEIWNSTKQKAVEIWQAVSDWFSETLTNTVSWFVQTWTAIKNKTVEIWTAIIEALKAFGAKLYEATGMKAYVEAVIAIWKFLFDTIVITAEMIYAIIRAIWLKIVEVVTPIVQGLIDFIVKMWNKLVDKTTSIFYKIQGFFIKVWTAIANILTPIIQKIVNFITKAWNKIMTTTSSVYNKLKQFVAKTWESLVKLVTSVTEKIYSTVTTKFNNLKNKASSIFNSLKNTLSSIWDSVKSKATSIASGIYTSVKSKFSKVTSAMTKPVDSAKSKIQSMLESIKKFFSGLKLTIPKPKLPKISVTKGTKSFLGQEIPYPKFSVSWNAKGNIFNGASILGGGQGVGEAGAEAVLPIEHKRYMQPFSSSIAEHLANMQDKDSSNGNVTNTFHIAQLVVREEADVERIAEELEKKQRKEQRAKGILTSS